MMRSLMSKIKIRKKDMKDKNKWTSFDFVIYFCNRYRREYDTSYEYLFGKDCSIMKRIISIFKKQDRPKTLIIDFIDWVFYQYQKRKDFSTPLTIGFLPYWIDEYFQAPVFENKKKKSEPVELSEEMKQWLHEQRELYRKKVKI
jgi:hypothetical protein